MSKKIDSISLGQGQGPKAEKLVREQQQRGIKIKFKHLLNYLLGGWVLLQNCHLA